MDRKIIGGIAWAGTALVVIFALGPVWFHWSDTVVAEPANNDVHMQMGLLEWSTANWDDPRTWDELPTLFPAIGAMGHIDSMLGQALIISPFGLFIDLTNSAKYNLVYLGSLLLAAFAMAAVWTASGGPRWASGPAALALVGAPYTFSQIPCLNQLPPPFVLFSLAALLAALRRQGEGKTAWFFWWLMGLCLVLQAAWSWYGLLFAVLGISAISAAWFLYWIRSRDATWPPIFTAVGHGIGPGILVVMGVIFLAQPHIGNPGTVPVLEDANQEIQLRGADIQHFWHRGIYRSCPADWIGQGVTPRERYMHGEQQTLHPGWVVLLLAPLGWWRRGYLTSDQRRVGRAFLIMGFVGLVLALGDSWAAWRFAWLSVIATAWWSAVGVVQLADVFAEKGPKALIAPVAIVLMTLLAIPAGVPSLDSDLIHTPEIETSVFFLN